MKKLILLTLFTYISVFSQTIVSEFPLDLKYKIGITKSTGEKWLPIEYKQTLHNSLLKHYSLENNKSIIVLNEENKTSFVILDKELKSIKKGSFKKEKRKFKYDVTRIGNTLPFHVTLTNNVLTFSYVKVESKTFFIYTKILTTTYNLDNKQETLHVFEENTRAERYLTIFSLNNDLHMITSPKSSNTLNFYKINVGENFEKIAEANIKELEYLTDKTFTIKADKTIKKTPYTPFTKRNEYKLFNETFSKTKIYIDKYKNELLLTFDNIHKNNNGTHIYSFNLDDFSRKDYSLIDYSGFNNQLKHNSVLSEDKLFQIGIDKNVIQLKTVDLNSKKETFHSFFKNDSLYRNNNTHYAKANFFSGMQKEKNNKSTEQFLNYTVKGEPAISSLYINNTSHLLLGSHRIVTRTSTMGGMTGGANIGLSITTSNEFDNYSYLSINNDSINTTNSLKDSFINQFTENNKENENIFLNTFFKHNEEYYKGFYDALNETYKIVRIDM